MAETRERLYFLGDAVSWRLVENPDFICAAAFGTLHCVQVGAIVSLLYGFIGDRPDGPISGLEVSLNRGCELGRLKP